MANATPIRAKFGAQDLARYLAQLIAVQEDEDRDDRDRHEDRDPRPRLTEPAGQRYLLRGDFAIVAVRRELRQVGELRQPAPEVDRVRVPGLLLAHPVRAPGPAAVAAGRIRRLPRSRWTTFAAGVHTRAT